MSATNSPVSVLLFSFLRQFFQVVHIPPKLLSWAPICKWHIFPKKVMYLLNSTKHKLEKSQWSLHDSLQPPKETHSTPLGCWWPLLTAMLPSSGRHWFIACLLNLSVNLQSHHCLYWVLDQYITIAVYETQLRATILLVISSNINTISSIPVPPNATI